MFSFAVAAALAGLAGALYVPQVGIITPSQIGVLPSLEVVVWVAAGGRGTLLGALIGAVGINAARSQLTAHFPEWWPIILGGLFVGVVLLFPDGVIGIPRQCKRGLQRLRAWRRRSQNAPATESSRASRRGLHTSTSRPAL
jgi:urea transport system permease protein